jgi:cell division protein FtsL
MDARKLLIAIACIVAVAIAVILTNKRIEQLTAERDRYKGNTAALLSDVELFKIRDSMNAARVESLQLTIKEFERFRADDAELIRELKARNRDLSAVNTTQSQTIIDLKATPRDTVIIVRDSIVTPAVAVHCGDAWFDFDGLLTKDQFTGTLANRDSLLLAETVKYKRFLGFLWKTKRVQDRRVDVVSQNPHTKILGVEHVVIEK